jgi:hypothetical protein
MKIKTLFAFLAVVFRALTLATVLQARAADVRLLQPLPWQVVQREGFVPHRAHEHEPGGPALGFASVEMSATLPEIIGEMFSARTVLLTNAYGKELAWTVLHPRRSGDKVSATLSVPAGGWYRLELRQTTAHQTNTAAVEPFGVGEVFVIAGQSYASGANDERLAVSEPQGRVVAFDFLRDTWAVAHDPQPNLGPNGTIWPPLGDWLVPLARVPVAFVNAAAGGSASRQWLPGEKLFERLAVAGKKAGRFRSVLWQQGESDVIEKVTTEKYVANLAYIRTSLVKEWGFEPPWLLSKSTMHPTVYNNPAGEAQIRAAIDQLARQPGFRPGPDTDILGGENRGDRNSRRHFTGLGQRRAALLWFSSVWAEINSPGH